MMGLGLWLVCVGTSSVILLCAVLLGLAFALRSNLDRVRSRQERTQPGRRLIGFFHPHSTGGGGGERVLWTMLNALMNSWPEDDFVVYTHWTGEGEATHDKLQELVLQKFGIALPRPVGIVPLQGIKWIEPSSYPRFTLLFQSLGALPLAWEALKIQVPDVFIDSMGLALAYPLARICGRCRVACYVHYPVVSSDMLAAVWGRQAKFNNSSRVARSTLLTGVKIVYYRMFAELYGASGRQSHVVMVNSSWTKGHIVDIWGLPSTKVHRVYPPCDVTNLISVGQGEKECAIVSVAQFRPEKDHSLQLRAFQKLLAQANNTALRLHLVGGVRNEEDQQRVEDLRKLAQDLEIGDRVDFHLNLPYADLVKLLDLSIIGLHTMRDEHFGIGVVEYMAAGCIPVAHNSAGPKMDIVTEGTGFLAQTADEYAEKMMLVLSMSPGDLAEMRSRGKDASQRFSEKVFADGVRHALVDLNPESECGPQ